VLKPGGLLLLAFHMGDEVFREKELWGAHLKWFYASSFCFLTMSGLSKFF